MRRVVLSIPYGLAFRNLACCGVLQACIDRGVGMTVLLPPLSEDDQAVVRPELPPRADVGELRFIRQSLFYTYLKALKQYHYSRRTSLGSFEIKYERRRRQQPLSHWPLAAAERSGAALCPEAVLDRILAAVPQPCEAYYADALRSSSADLVAITKPGFHPDELPLIKAARRRGIPVLAVDTTWDNMASKRPAYLMPEGVTVWNRWMVDDAVTYYGFAPSAVFMTGGTQFDVLFEPSPAEDRRSLLLRLKLDPDRQLIVFSLNAPMFAPDNVGFIRLLLEGIASGAIAGRPNLLVRTHPFDRESRYDNALSVSRSPAAVEQPFLPSTAQSRFECLPTRLAVRHYGALMRHADVLINQASTTSLDAMATDTPVVNIAYELNRVHPDLSIARVYGFTHYRRIVESRAVRLVFNTDELFSTLTMYLRDRSVDGEHRERARDAFFAYRDDRTAERMATAIGNL